MPEPENTTQKLEPETRPVNPAPKKKEADDAHPADHRESD